MGKFLALVNLMRGFTKGAPIFGSPNMFIMTLKHQGMIGPLLKTMGLEPITFFSEGEVKKAITTESKVFSLIATGHVKTGKRDTRVRIHAVIDFRSAPAPAMLLQNALAQAAGAKPGAVPGAASAGGAQPLPTPSASGTTSAPFAPGTTPPAGLTADGIGALLVPSPGGRIVYFRID